MGKRVSDQKRQHAELGRPTSGTPPYGYRRVGGRFVVDEKEATALRFMVVKLSEGMSLTGVCRELDRLGVPTRTGKGGWKPQTVYANAINPAAAGLRHYHGEILGDAEWPAIIAVEDHRALVLLLKDPARKVRRPATGYLLSGLMRNAVDGSRLRGHTEYRNGEFYRTTYKSQPMHPSVCVDAVGIERVVTEDVLDALDTASLPSLRDGDKRGAAAAKALEAVNEELVELARDRASGDLTRPEWEILQAPLKQRKTELGAEVRATRPSTTALALLGRAKPVRNEWQGMPVDQRQAVIADLVDHINVGPIGRGRRMTAVERLSMPGCGIVWRG